jgi:hypothetical protein
LSNLTIFAFFSPQQNRLSNFFPNRKQWIANKVGYSRADWQGTGYRPLPRLGPSNHTGRKPLQQTIRGGNPYNKPYREATPTTNPIMSLGNTGGDSVQLKPNQLKVLSPSVWNTTGSEHTPRSCPSVTRGWLGSTQTRSTQSVVSLGLKHNRLGTHTLIMSLGNTGVTRFNSNQINSKCCLPRFETQPARNTHPDHVPG